MFGFSKRGRLEEIEGADFVLGIGTWGLRARGTVRLLATDAGYDLRLGPATLEMLNGAAWSNSQFQISDGIAGDARFEGRRFAIAPGEFEILELPGEPWFGLGMALTEYRADDGPCVLSTIKLGLGITKDKRFRKALREAKWLPGRSAHDPNEPEYASLLGVLHERDLPAEHNAVPIAPELYAVLLDPEEGCIRFKFERAEYEAQLRRWQSTPIAVMDQERPLAISPALRRLHGAAHEFSSLLLLPWLVTALEQSSRGTPVFQLFEDGPLWIDSDDPTWQETLEEERERRSEEGGGVPEGPPLVFRDGHWLNAVTALKAS